MTDLDPSRIMEIGTGYRRSKVLLSALGLRIFPELADTPLTLRENRRTFGLQPRPAADFLHGLVSLGLLDREGQGDDACYRNTPETAYFLDHRSPAYIGGVLELWEARNFRICRLDGGAQDGLRTKRGKALRTAVLRDAS